MMQRKIGLMLAGLSIGMISFGQLTYPETKKVDQVDNYFGKKVEDPYRWLEDDNSEQTKDWVKAQNEVTQKYLSAIPYREQIRTRLSAMWNYVRYGIPFRQGNYLYFSKNDGLQNQSVYYRQPLKGGEPEVFLDPNKLSADGTAALGSISFSDSAKYMSYMLAQSGSDWQEVYVMDVQSGKLVNDKLQYIKFSGISWNGDDGFYYSRYPVPDEKTKMSGQNEFHKVYYHKIGNPQSADKLVFEDKDHAKRTVGASLSENNRFLFLRQSEGTSGTELWVKDLKAPNPEFKLLVKGFQNEASPVDADGDRVLIRTNIDAPNYQVVSIDPANPAKENWEVIIPTRTKLLQDVNTAGGKLLLVYLEDASSRIYQTDYKGHLERSIALPGIGTVGGFNGKKSEDELYYSFSSYNTPPLIYKYSTRSGASTLFKKTEVSINTDEFTTMQTFFTSKDGTKVPMFITYKKGLKLDGQNPVLLYGYGGFNVAQTPGFSISNAFFLEQGGVYAVVNLRGGNEYGEEWHKQGMLKNKQNVFNDFIAAAEWLIEKKYTNLGETGDCRRKQWGPIGWCSDDTKT